MKKNSCFRVLSIGLFVFVIHPIHSQVNDAGLWENIYLEKKLTSKWNVHLNEEGRINQNITRFYYAYADFGVTYKLNKHIHLTYDYVYIEKKDKDDFWNINHQTYFAITLKQKIGHFVFSDRIMPQVQYTKVYSSENGRIPDYQIRNKATIKYNNNSRYTYYVACELNYKLNSYYNPKKSSGSNFIRERYFAGVFYELNKMNEIELYYLIERHIDVSNPTTNYVIGIGYAHYF